MASKPRDLVVRFASDVAGFLRGTDQMSDALEDAARDQDELARKGDLTARKLATAYDRASDSIKRDSKEAQRATKDAYADAGTEAGDEFAANLGESISSGDVSGLLSGTVGGLVGTFGKGGPIALALSALAGVGVGVFQAISAEAEKSRAAAQTAFDELREGATREAKLNSVLTDRFGGTLAGWEQIQRYSEASGVSTEAIADALVSGGAQAKQLADKFDAILKTNYETYGVVDATTGVLVDGVDDLRDRATAMERAAAAAKVEASALGRSEGALKRSAAYYAARGSAYAPGGSVYQSQVPDVGRYAKGRR